MDYSEPSDVNPETVISEVPVRQVLTRNQSPDVPFDLSVNPYQGCEHGCIYCYARPSHAYFDLSPGLDFETRILARTNAVSRLRETLGRPGYRCAPIAVGANTDAYQPAERNQQITRGILKLALECRQPLVIITKSSMIERDRDLLGELARKRLAHIMVSITTLDEDLKRRLEPRAASPKRRLQTVRRLAECDIPVGVMVAPVIPGLTDHELESILAASADAGARSGSFILLRLPHEVEPLFNEWLDNHYPLRAGKVRSLIRQLRGGRLNDSRFGHRMRGQGPWAELLKNRFQAAIRKNGLEKRLSPRLDTTGFRPPCANAGQKVLEF